MNRIPTAKRREVAPYLTFLRLLDEDVPLDTRLFHVLYEFDRDDFDRIAEILETSGLTAGFSVPARRLRDRDAVADAIAAMHDAGHEILVHGDRHASFRDASYDVAHDELSRALDTIEAAIGVAPEGFHIPFMQASDGTVRAAADLGVEWLVGVTTGDDAAALPTVTPEHPYDLQLLERGHSPDDAVARVDEMVDDSSLLLCHPNVHLYHEATAAFAEYLHDHDFVPPGELVCRGGDTPGLLLDCFAPFSVR